MNNNWFQTETYVGTKSVSASYNNNNSVSLQDWYSTDDGSHIPLQNEIDESIQSKD